MFTELILWANLKINYKNKGCKRVEITVWFLRKNDKFCIYKYFRDFLPIEIIKLDPLEEPWMGKYKGCKWEKSWKNDLTSKEKLIYSGPSKADVKK